jgi:hypothetical protein
MEGAANDPSKTIDTALFTQLLIEFLETSFNHRKLNWPRVAVNDQ